MKAFWAPGILVFGAVIALPGCGSNDDDAFELPQNAGGEVTYDPTTATATVSGRLVFDGPPPEMPFLDMGGDFYCQRTGVGLTDQEVLVTEAGLLGNVMVYVRSGHDPTLNYSVPAAQVILDQDRCVYTPRVLTLMTGQELLIRNSDSTVHNVHADREATTLFNFAQSSGPRENIEIFDEPGIPIHVGCDLHRWMDAYLGVFDHPFHTTSGDTGTFSLNLPPGSYEIVAWHERYGEQRMSVELTEGSSASVDFTFRDPGP